MLVMTILAVLIVMVCLCSVSAVEESQLNSTLETVNEISQDENIVINEINENADDAGVEDTGSVSVKNEKNGENLLKATDDNQLKSSNNPCFSKLNRIFYPFCPIFPFVFQFLLL